MRLPEAAGSFANLEGFQIPRLSIPQGMDARLVVAAFLKGKNP